MRLIDADELLKHSCHYNFEEHGYFEFDAVDVGVIRDAPTVIVEPRWISVLDRLPEKEGTYVCIFVQHWFELRGACYVSTKYMSEDDKKHASEHRTKSVVLAEYLKDDDDAKDGFYTTDEDGDLESCWGVQYWLETPEIPEF